MVEDDPESMPAEVNQDIAAVIAGLEQQIDSLKTNLETQRLLNHPQKAQLVQELIAQIDERQDQLELLHNMGNN